VEKSETDKKQGGGGRGKGGRGGQEAPQLRTHCYRALLEILLADLVGWVCVSMGVSVGGCDVWVD